MIGAQQLFVELICCMNNIVGENLVFRRDAEKEIFLWFKKTGRERKLGQLSMVLNDDKKRLKRVVKHL